MNSVEKEIAEDKIKIKAIEDIIDVGPTFSMLPNYEGYLTQDAEGMDKLWRRFLTFIRDGLQENVDNLEMQNDK